MFRTLLAALFVLGCAGTADAGPKVKQRQTTKPAGGPVVVTGGWGCRDCGYLNGTRLTGIDGLNGPASLVPASVILPSGASIDLRAPEPERRVGQ